MSTKTNMMVLRFIVDILKKTINNNTIVFLLELLRKTNLFYITSIAVVISMITLLPSETKPILSIIPNIRMIPQVLFVGVYSMPVFVPVYAIFKYKSIPKHVLTYSSIKGVSTLSNFFDYYYTLIPVCLVTTGIALMTLMNVHVYFFLAGVVLFFLGWYVLFMLTLLKVVFYKMGTFDRYNNITRANDILTNYIPPNETDIKYLAIKEFTKCFKRVLDGIDSHFYNIFNKIISIDSLQTKENITVKQLIVRYLPLYLNYCSETELNSFKTKINSMTNLIDNENAIVSLDIIKIVYSIHQDIVTFLNQHHYVVPKNNILTKFIYYLNNKKMYYMEVSFSLFILSGLFVFLIPHETLTNIFNELFDYISDNNIVSLTYISSVIALVTILYKLFKELNKDT